MAEVRVLIVPPTHSFPSLKHIVLAIDQKDICSSVLAPLQKLALNFIAKVTVLNVHKSSNKNKINNVEFPIRDVETTYREVLMIKSINESIGEFIKKEKCDLLCMVRRKKNESVFQTSITKDQVYKNQIPLLILPEN